MRRGRHPISRRQSALGIGVAFDPGVMWELILRRSDLAPVRERFLRSPQDAARVLMSRTWR
jgi:phenylglyoxylate dehydrogenase epsilon subunit